MKIIDVPEPSKIDRKPDQAILLIQKGNSVQNNFEIQTVEIRLKRILEKIRDILTNKGVIIKKYKSNQS